MSNEDRTSALECPVWLLTLPNRKAAALERLHRMGWMTPNIVEAFYIGYPKGPSLSHAEALKQAMRRAEYPFIIFEDDACATDDFRAISLPWQHSPDCLFLHQEKTGAKGDTYGTGSRWIDLDGEFVRLRNMLGLYSVVVFSEAFALAYLEVCMASARWGVAVDVVFVQLMKHFRVLGLWRPLIFQGPAGQNNNEWSSRHRLPRSMIDDGPDGQVYGWADWGPGR